jgi:hypothetical protein
MILPQEGGCWYCGGDGGEMVFSYEFDCWLHLPCLQTALSTDPTDSEARIMARELIPGMLQDGRRE